MRAVFPVSQVCVECRLGPGVRDADDLIVQDFFLALLRAGSAVALVAFVPGRLIASRAPAQHLARAQVLAHDLGHGHDPEAVGPLP